MLGKYLLRSLKYLLYISCLIAALLVLVYFTSNHADGLRFTDLIHPSRQRLFVLFLLAVAAVYPAVSFDKRQLWSSGTFAQDKDIIKRVMQNARYTLVYEDAQTLKFRPQGFFARLRRQFEDVVVFDGSQSPMVLEGMRRDTLRFSNSVGAALRQEHPEQ